MLPTRTAKRVAARVGIKLLFPKWLPEPPLISEGSGLSHRYAVVLSAIRAGSAGCRVADVAVAIIAVAALGFVGNCIMRRFNACGARRPFTLSASVYTVCKRSERSLLILCGLVRGDAAVGYPTSGFSSACVGVQLPYSWGSISTTIRASNATLVAVEGRGSVSMVAVGTMQAIQGVVQGRTFGLGLRWGCGIITRNYSPLSRSPCRVIITASFRRVNTLGVINPTST